MHYTVCHESRSPCVAAVEMATSPMATESLK